MQALIYTKEGREMSVEEHSLTISYANTCKTTTWETYDKPLKELAALWVTHVERDSKDGPCFIPGALEEGRRSKHKVLYLSAMVYDVDGGMSFADAAKLVDDSPYMAFLYTTHSHMVATTRLNRKPFNKWWDVRDYPLPIEKHIDIDTVNSYLQEIGKKFVDNVRIEDITTDEIRITHDPIEKFRVIYPLARNFYMDHASFDTNVAAEVWALTYAEIGKNLGIPFDPSCADPARLYFFPAHTKGGQHAVHFSNGDFLDHNDFDINDEDLHEQAQRRAGQKRDRIEDVVVVSTEDHDNFNLSQWFSDSWGKLRIQDLFATVAPERIIADKGDKTEITCPFEDEHTSIGGNGTIVSNYRDNSRFGVNCLHTSCMNRSALSFISKMLTNGWFTVNELVAFTDKITPAEKRRKTFLERQRLLSAGTSESEESLRDRANKLYGALPNVIPGIPDGDMPDGDNLDGDNLDGDNLDGDNLDGDNLDGALSLAERHAAKHEGKGRKDKNVIIPESDELDKFIEKAVKIEYGYELVALITANAGVLSNPRTEAKLFAYTQIPHKLVGDYYKLRASEMRMTPKEFENLTREIRLEVYNYKAVMAALIAEQPDNLKSSSRKNVLKQYLGLDNKTFNKMYAEVQQEVTGSSIPPELRKKLEEFDNRYGKLLNGRDVDIIDIVQSYDTSKRVSTKPGGMKHLYSNSHVSYVEGDGNMVEVNIFDYWMERWPEHKTYTGVTFDPTEKDPLAFNLWRGFSLKPKEGDFQMIDEHIRETWCDNSPELYGWITTFLAQMFQQPEYRYPAAISIVGSQGSGKSIVFQYGLQRMLGPYFYSLNNGEQLTGRWNGQVLGTTLACVSEEAVFHGNSKVMQTLKDLISTKEMSMEEKFGDTRMRPLFARMFFLSNELHALGLEQGDRRFCVLKTNDVHARDKVYFTEMADRFYGRGQYEDMSAAWMYYLMNLDPKSLGMTWADLFDTPTTQAKAFQIAASRSPEMTFFYDYMVHGTFTLVNEAHFDKIVPWSAENDTLTLPLEEFVAMYRDFMSEYDKRYLRYAKSGYESAFTKTTGLSFESCVHSVPNGKGGHVAMLHLPSRRALIEELYKKGDIVKWEHMRGMQDYISIDENKDGEEVLPSPANIEVTNKDRPELDILFGGEQLPMLDK